MVLCEHNCIPCCDFCIYVKHTCYHEYDNNHKIQLIQGEPIACALYNDKEHNKIAENCGYCNDFHCYNADK